MFTLHIKQHKIYGIFKFFHLSANSRKKISTPRVIWVLLFFLLLGKVNTYTNITVYKCANKSSTILKKKNFNLRTSLWANQEEKATTSCRSKKAYIQGPENEGKYKRHHAQEGCKVKACGDARRSLWQWPGSPWGHVHSIRPVATPVLVETTSCVNISES